MENIYKNNCKDSIKDDLFKKYPKSTLDRFKNYHLKNPQVYKAFKDYAFKMRATGKKRYSSETIINVIRWHIDLETKGDVFEINNDYKSLYARLLIYHHPEFREFFELRDTPCRGKKSKEQLKREAEQ